MYTYEETKITYKPTIYILLVMYIPTPPPTTHTHTIYNQDKCISDPNKYKWTNFISEKNYFLLYAFKKIYLKHNNKKVESRKKYPRYTLTREKKYGINIRQNDLIECKMQLLFVKFYSLSYKIVFFVLLKNIWKV